MGAIVEAAKAWFEANGLPYMERRPGFLVLLCSIDGRSCRVGVIDAEVYVEGEHICEGIIYITGLGEVPEGKRESVALALSALNRRALGKATITISGSVSLSVDLVVSANAFGTVLFEAVWVQLLSRIPTIETLVRAVVGEGLSAEEALKLLLPDRKALKAQLLQDEEGIAWDIPSDGGYRALDGGETGDALCDVVLLGPGNDEARAIFVLHGITGLTLAAIRELLRAVPVEVLTGLTKEEAAMIVEYLGEQGLRAEIKERHA